jgi:hypothetical protein
VDRRQRPSEHGPRGDCQIAGEWRRQPLAERRDGPGCFAGLCNRLVAEYHFGQRKQIQAVERKRSAQLGNAGLQGDVQSPDTADSATVPSMPLSTNKPLP